MKRIKLTLAMFAAASFALAADPTMGTWKLNTDKSKISPGPAPKSLTSVYSQDGDWVVVTTDGVAADGTKITRRNRYKRDGSEYKYDSPNGPGKISIKKVDDHHYTAVTKLDSGGTVNTHSVVSKDGKIRTQTSTGTNAKGEKVNTVVVFDKQ